MSFRTAQLPTGSLGRRSSMGAGGRDSPYAADLTAPPYRGGRPGPARVLDTLQGPPPRYGGDIEFLQHRRVFSAHRANPPRTNLVVVPEHMVEVEDEEESSEASMSTSSSTYLRHHRYENPFTAYQLVSDPYDRHREIERQQRFINDSKRLGQPFIPSGGRALEKPTRYMLGDCVAALYRTIARDWPETDPVVISTAEDLLVVYMKRDRVRHTGTVLRYMNASLKRNEAVRTFDLRKVPEGWDVLTDDGHMMYTFKPPWVRQRRFLPDQVVARKAH